MSTYSKVAVFTRSGKTQLTQWFSCDQDAYDFCFTMGWIKRIYAERDMPPDLKYGREFEYGDFCSRCDEQIRDCDCCD